MFPARSWVTIAYMWTRMSRNAWLTSFYTRTLVYYAYTGTLSLFPCHWRFNARKSMHSSIADIGPASQTFMASKHRSPRGIRVICPSREQTPQMFSSQLARLAQPPLLHHLFHQRILDDVHAYTCRDTAPTDIVWCQGRVKYCDRLRTPDQVDRLTFCAVAWTQLGPPCTSLRMS